MTNTWWSLSPNSFFKAEWDSVFRIGYDGFVGGGSNIERCSFCYEEINRKKLQKEIREKIL